MNLYVGKSSLPATFRLSHNSTTYSWSSGGSAGSGAPAIIPWNCTIGSDFTVPSAPLTDLVSPVVPSRIGRNFFSRASAAGYSVEGSEAVI